jgi:putative addiction module component (TIGR02574 family)
MNATKDTIIAEALQLNDADRREVVERLSDSLGEAADVVVAAAWDREIDRRLDAVASGQAIFSSWHDARQRIARK